MPSRGGVRARLTAAVVALIVRDGALGIGVGAVRRRASPRPGPRRGRRPGPLRPVRDRPGPPAAGPATRDDIDRSALADTFRLRRVETVVDLGPDQPPFLSRSDLAGLLERLPPDMRAQVDRGQLTYAWLDVGGVPSLVVGGRPAGGGPAFYFVHDVSGLQDASTSCASH